jgi:hypothetical protein
MKKGITLAAVITAAAGILASTACGTGASGGGATGTSAAGITVLPAQTLCHIAGDFNGDCRADLALVGGVGWQTLPVGFSNGDGTFNVTNAAGGALDVSAGQVGALMVTGDFNGDRKTDIALTGGVGWNTVMVGFSNGDGTFNVTNAAASIFAGYAQEAGAYPVAGDFNGDGKWDIALVGGVGWNTVPVAFSNGDGTFNVTNSVVATLPAAATQAGARAIAGDFNHDGKGDIAFVGGAGWNTVLVALSSSTLSNPSGTFNVTNIANPAFAALAAEPGVTPLAGDFDGDGKGDIALVGGATWDGIPLALSNGDGSFTDILQINTVTFPIWASEPGVLPTSGDYNGDGKADIALVGGAEWAAVPVAFSNGNGTFGVTNDLNSLLAAASWGQGAVPASAQSNGFANPEATCNRLISEMTFYTLAIASDVHAGCPQESRDTQYMSTIAAITNQALPYCSAGGTAPSVWGPNLWGGLLQANQAIGQCSDAQSIALRCPVQETTDITLAVTLFGANCKYDQIDCVYRVCPNPADIPLCNQHFGNPDAGDSLDAGGYLSMSLSGDELGCNENLFIAFSECMTADQWNTALSTPPPAPQAPNPNLGPDGGDDDDP